MDSPTILNNIKFVQQSVDKANGLSNEHYVDPLMFKEESEAIIKSSWSGLAVGADIPNIGDAKPLNFLGIPLLLIRDNDFRVRVFENICRHRGMKLINHPKKNRRSYSMSLSFMVLRQNWRPHQHTTRWWPWQKFTPVHCERRFRIK
jgi:hypothetical protein